MNFEPDVLKMPMEEKNELNVSSYGESCLPILYKLTDERTEIMNKISIVHFSSEIMKNISLPVPLFWIHIHSVTTQSAVPPPFPLNRRRALKMVIPAGKTYKEKAHFGKMGHLIRTAFFTGRQRGTDPLLPTMYVILLRQRKRLLLSTEAK